MRFALFGNATNDMPDVYANGLTFHFEERGSGVPLFLLHGFTGQSESWSTTIEILKGKYRTIAIDLVGHGRTDAPADVSRYAFSQATCDLADIGSCVGIRQAVWLGYSMGGRLALGVALRHPEIVSALILESASPGIADSAEREQRRVADELLASRIESGGVPAFVAEWESLPIWQSQRSLTPIHIERQRSNRLANRANGLAGSLRGMGAGAQKPFWDNLALLQTPTLLIAGELDAKFVDIAARMVSMMPAAQLQVVPGAGHAVHLEQPALFAEAVSRFITQHANVAVGN